MRPANLTLKAAALAALTLCVATASALTPPPQPDLALAPGAAASAPAAKPLTSAAVHAVSMGKPAAGNEQAKKLGTVAELEELQMQTSLAEARKRLQELTRDSAATGEKSVSGSDHGSDAAAPVKLKVARPPELQELQELKVNPKVARKRKAAEVASSASFSAPDVSSEPVMESPKAKLVTIVVVGGRARADVLEDGRMFTVKEGDKVGAWTVTRIAGDGVTVEFRYSVDAPAAALTPPDSTESRPAVAAAFPAAYSMINSQRPTEQRDKARTMKLKSATLQEIAAVTGPAPAFSAAGAPPSLPATGTPAGGNGMADSTSVAAVPPLPPALGR